MLTHVGKRGVSHLGKSDSPAETIRILSFFHEVHGPGPHLAMLFCFALMRAYIYIYSIHIEHASRASALLQANFVVVSCLAMIEIWQALPM